MITVSSPEDRDQVVARAVATVLRQAPALREDLISEATVAYLEGEAPAAILKRLRKYIVDACRVQGSGRRDGTVKVVGRPVSLSPMKRLTPFQKTTIRRNLVIQAARRQGCSIGLLAGVFDLPRSLMAKIVKKDLGRAFDCEGT